MLMPQLGFGSIEDDAVKFVHDLGPVPAAIEAQKLINQCTTCYPAKVKSEQKSIPALDHKTKYLIFISCSMPEESIKLLYAESLNHNATLVMRGLLAGSFKKTTAKLQELHVVAQINPKLFKQYHIDRVPTIVVVGDGYHHSIAGNISFNYAKEQLLEAG